MRALLRPVVLGTIAFLVSSGALHAQSAAPPPAEATDRGWKFAIYPVLAWLPIHVDIDVNLPPGPGGGGQGGSILNSHFDGAFLAGFSATNGVWRVDTDGLWAKVGGDRPELPNLSVDLQVIYGHGTVGRRLGNDLYVTGGMRRIAAKYDVRLGDRPEFSRKPGVWDPLVGLAWHRERERLAWHAVLEGGGFGVGSDADIGASFRLDWKPVTHFGLTAGYALLYFKVSQDVAGQTFVAKQTLDGPIVGVGLYF